MLGLILFTLDPPTLVPDPRIPGEQCQPTKADHREGIPGFHFARGISRIQILGRMQYVFRSVPSEA